MKIILLWFRKLVTGLLPCLFLFILISSALGQNIKPLKIGILTDCQYCNCPSEGNRFYRLSLSKLDRCVTTLNSFSLDGIFHLGDMIDHDYGSYDSIIPRFNKFNPKIHLVLGNHDYMIKKKFKPGLINHLGMNEGYYTVDYGDWRFIILNGNDLSYFGPQDKEQKAERNEVVSDQYGNLHFNGLPWNGGIGKEQLAWLESKLKESEQLNMKVIVACHFPLFTKENHNLFNNKEVFHLLSRYLCVKAYFCGHYHSGSYRLKEGIHLVNFKGMVDTDKNAFAVVTLKSDSILIKGYGREPDRNLKIR